MQVNPLTPPIVHLVVESPLQDSLNHSNNLLEDLMESNELCFNDFEKFPDFFNTVVRLNEEVAATRKEAPQAEDNSAVVKYAQKVEELVIYVSSKVTDLKKETIEHKVNHVFSRKNISFAQAVLEETLSEIKELYPKMVQITSMLVSKLNFWKEHESSTCTDIKKFNERTAHFINSDFFLLMFVGNETALFKQNGSERSLTEVFASLDQHDLLAIGHYSEEQMLAFKEDIKRTVLDAKKTENLKFIKNLSVLKKEFNTAGYTAIGDFYSQQARDFKKVACALGAETTEKFENEWAELVAKFDKDHELFAKLRSPEKKMQSFFATAEKLVQLETGENEQRVELQEKLKSLPLLMDKKAGLRDVAGIECYIDEVLGFLAELEGFSKV